MLIINVANPADLIHNNLVLALLCMFACLHATSNQNKHRLLYTTRTFFGSHVFIMWLIALEPPSIKVFTTDSFPVFSVELTPIKIGEQRWSSGCRSLLKEQLSTKRFPL
mmetsp:Transcript_50203/g.93481  ORF Transcript_50203/g.93481 Transcript_50203/m.93481 type:complete len:109 (+) Transcript_50203:98-424(+)